VYSDQNEDKEGEVTSVLRRTAKASESVSVSSMAIRFDEEYPVERCTTIHLR